MLSSWNLSGWQTSLLICLTTPLEHKTAFWTKEASNYSSLTSLVCSLNLTSLMLQPSSDQLQYPCWSNSNWRSLFTPKVKKPKMNPSFLFQLCFPAPHLLLPSRKLPKSTRLSALSNLITFPWIYSTSWSLVWYNFPHRPSRKSLHSQSGWVALPSTWTRKPPSQYQNIWTSQIILASKE